MVKMAHPGSPGSVAIKLDVYVYMCVQDYKAYQPVHQVEMQTASIKELSKCRLEFRTHYVSFE